MSDERSVAEIIRQGCEASSAAEVSIRRDHLKEALGAKADAFIKDNAKGNSGEIDRVNRKKLLEALPAAKATPAPTGN